MAERRRRRLSEESVEDDTEPASEKATTERPSECESEGEGAAEDAEASDYESAVDEKEDKEDDESEDDSSTEEDSSDDEDEDDSDDDTAEETEDVEVEESLDGWVDEERQSGDGEEQPDQGKDKPLDDDEDLKNPAFVPRKGAFYEHDRRIQDVEEESQKPKKKLWMDDGKWLHDRYRDDQQAPKTKEDIVAIYGYDIRAHERPPDGPRRTRGSRVGRGRGRRLGDYIQNESHRYSNRNETTSNSSRSSDHSSQHIDYGSDRASSPTENRDYVERKNIYNRYQSDTRRRPNYGGLTRRHDNSYNKVENYQNKDYDGRNSKFDTRPPPTSPRQVKNTNFNKRDQPSVPDKSPERTVTIVIDQSLEDYPRLGNENAQNPTRYDTYGNTPEKKSIGKERKNKYIGTTRVQRDYNIESAEHEMNKMSLKEKTGESSENLSKGDQVSTSPTTHTQDIRKTDVIPPPRPQKADLSQQNRSKRYSTQRQRPGAEASYPDQAAPEGSSTFFNSGFPPPPVYRPDHPPPSVSNQEHKFPPPPTILQPPMAFTIPASTPSLASRPRMFSGAPPPSVPLPASQPLISPQFITPGMMYGVPPAAPFQLPAPMPPVQSFPTPPPTTSQQSGSPDVALQNLQELYRGGTTYYYPDMQPFTSPIAQMRRTKAAIPIVKPQIYESSLSPGPAGDGGEGMKAQPGSPARDEHLYRQEKRNPKPSETKQGARSNRQSSVSSAPIIEAQT